MTNTVFRQPARLFGAPLNKSVRVDSLLRCSVMAGLSLSICAAVAQTPAAPVAPVAPAATAATVAPLEAYTDPRWTGQAQPASVIRKEAAAALVEGRRRCAGEARGVSRNECLRVVNDDHRLMLANIRSNSRR